MKTKKNSRSKSLLSDKIAEAFTVKARADIEDDQVFGTKPQTVSHVDYTGSESDEEVAISDFRKRNVNLLSEISTKYVGDVVSQKDLKSYPSDKSNSEDSDVSNNPEYANYIADRLGDIENDMSNSSSYEQESKKIKPSKSLNHGINDSITSSQRISDSDDEDESDDYDITRSQTFSDNDESSKDGTENENEGYDISQMNEPVTENFEHLKKQNDTEEVKKGACVRNQLQIWEGLLEMRIHLQRCMNTANQMPMPNIYEDLKQSNEFVEECNISKSQVSNMLDKLLMLQNILLSKYPETKTLSLKIHSKEPNAESNSKSEEEIPSDTENEEIPSDTDVEEITEQKIYKTKDSKILQNRKRKLQHIENELATTHKSLKTFRDSVIQKWNDKTRINTTASIKNAPTNTILQQISYILSDRNKLIKRSQLKRSEYDIVGYEGNPAVEEHKDENEIEINPVSRDRKANDEYIPEIFDDSDFYHQLLRELIECKSADISDPVQLSRHWIALQQMRSKMKRKVDTKATKGRKIKYVVHNQLVNFMASVKGTTWTDESTNELYSSLFGKMFEHNKIGFSLDSDLKIDK